MVYIDGSKQENGQAGRGFIRFIGSDQVLYGLFLLGLNKEVFDAEAIVALQGLKTAI